MAVVPITAAGEHDDPATPIDSPVRRILRRPSERYRRERPRQLRYRLAIGIAEVVSRIVAWLPDRVRDGIADRAGDIWIRLTPVYRENVIANLSSGAGTRDSAGRSWRPRRGRSFACRPGISASCSG